ncbi:unnamed protein product, partial [Ectocarpus sp. 12 AP-2014]
MERSQQQQPPPTTTTTTLTTAARLGINASNGAGSGDEVASDELSYHEWRGRVGMERVKRMKQHHKHKQNRLNPTMQQLLALKASRSVRLSTSQEFVEIDHHVEQSGGHDKFMQIRSINNN